VLPIPDHPFKCIVGIIERGWIFMLRRQFVNAEGVFTSEIRLVNGRLGSTDNHLEMISIVEDFLLHLVRRRRVNFSTNTLLPIDKVSQFLLHNPTRFSLD
jgi:hypothetical protein